MDDVLLNLEKQGVRLTVFDSLISLVTKIAILFPNYVLYYLVLKGYCFSEIRDPSSFFFYNKLFVTAKSKFNDLRANFLTFAQHKTDIEFSNIKDCENDQKEEETHPFLFEKEIKLQNFGLVIEDKQLFKNTNLSIKKGDKIAIVGKNGVGKSSIIGVLLRLKEYEGDIFIDDINMKSINKVSQRDKFSYVPQNPGLMSGTVLYNITYGKKGISREDAVKMCEEYEMHDDFMDLKDGYETNVGECGKYLSGGQKQKVGFMRAVVKDGEIFIFDEPTANIDPKTELKIFNLIFNNLKNKTIIAIVHNQKLLEMFDRIVGVNNMEFREYNSYKEYLENQHLY